MTIQSIKAIQVLDSRGLPTVSCSICLENGAKASAIVPSGASTGTKEALRIKRRRHSIYGKRSQEGCR